MTLSSTAKANIRAMSDEELSALLRLCKMSNSDIDSAVCRAVERERRRRQKLAKAA